MSSKETKYHIAIDSQGYLLRGSPERPKRTMKKAPVFGNRFASGDRDYTDLSFWWFWAQTDWSGGFKDARAWINDAKYWFSTNLDVYSETGAVQLEKDSTLLETFSYDISAGVNGIVNGASVSYIGTEENADSKAEVWSSSDEATWTSIKEFAAHTNVVNKLYIRKNHLWVLNNAFAGNTEIVNWWDGNATWEDCSPDIYNAGGTITYNIEKATAICEVGDDVYIAVENYSNDYVAIVKASKAGPTATGDWSKVLDHNANASIVAMEEYDGDVYYLLHSTKQTELRKYDVTNSVDSLVKTFKNTSYSQTKLIDRHLFNYNGKLVILVPQKEIWEYDGTTLTRIWKRDDTKYDDYNTYEAVGYIYRGGVEFDGRLYFSNLIYDGEYFYNWIKNVDDNTTKPVIPIFVNENNNLFHTDTGNDKKLYGYNTTTFRSGSDKNFMLLSEVEELSTIDKLAHSVTLIFDNFEAGEEIEVQYSIDGGENWTVLGNASYALDGASTTRKTLKFGDTVIYSKILFKVLLNGDGTSSPKYKDISLQHLPMPDYKYQWTFQVNCTNEMNLLDGQTKEPKRGEELRNILRASFLKQEIIELEDVDYVETQLNEALDNSETEITVDDTSGYPEQGRIKIENEEIKYTSKSATEFKGCTRGYRGTTAVTHSNDTAVSNKYKALIIEYDERTPIAEDYNPNEYIVQLTLVEA